MADCMRCGGSGVIEVSDSYDDYDSDGNLIDWGTGTHEEDCPRCKGTGVAPKYFWQGND